MTDAPVENDAIRSVTRLVAASGVVIAGLGLVAYGARFAGSSLVGTAIAVLNFVVLARVGRALTEEGSSPLPWSMLYLFKIAALFGGMFLLLRSGSIHLLGLLAGLSSLVPGIVLGGVAASRREP